MEMRLIGVHKNNRKGGICSIMWNITAKHIVTASSSDASILIHDAILRSKKPTFLRNHKEGVTSLAFNPSSTCLASGSSDCSVKLYKFPGGELLKNIAVFTRCIRALSFYRSGCVLGVGGDDCVIKIIRTIDGSVVKELQGHRCSVIGLAFDPKGEYLASVDSVGTVMIWNLDTADTVNTLECIGINVFDSYVTSNSVGWSPDGEMLAVSTNKCDVSMYKRDGAEKLFTLSHPLRLPVYFLSWSPNGKYIATSGMDMTVFIWNVDDKTVTKSRKFNEVVCGMAWKPHENSLALIDVMGSYGVWDMVVPLDKKSPTDGAPDLTWNVGNGPFLSYDKEEHMASLRNHGEDSILASEIPNKKRLRRHVNHDEVTPTGPVVRQEAFQPGSTPVQPPGKRRFLCYNMFGSITTMELNGYSHIEVEYHDSGIDPNVFALTDHFGFTMASLNKYGSVFACPCNGKKNISTLMYRPLKCSDNNSEWSMNLEEDEEVRAVALGSSWVAAVTSLNFLRIFSEGGLQTHVVSLDGPVVTASGFGDELSVVTHSSPLLSSDEQMLELRHFNVSNGTQNFRGRVLLTHGSYLTWFGFSEEGQLSTFDSMGVLRVFINQFGGSWLPLFCASKSKKKNESCWVVGLDSSKLFCIICKSPEKFPQAIPKPALTLLDLSIPLASSDLGAQNLESEFIIRNMHLSQIQRRIEVTEALGQDTTSLSDKVFDTKAALDKCILKLIEHCCKGGKLVRAIELAKLLSLEKSVRDAIQGVARLQLPNLVESFNSILEKKVACRTQGRY